MPMVASPVDWRPTILADFVVVVGICGAPSVTAHSSVLVCGGAEVGELGGLCGSTFEGTISCCYADGVVQAGDNARSVGGFCGSNRGTIENCYFRGQVLCGNYAMNCGGFCGWNRQTVQKAYVSGAVFVGDYSEWIGGFSGNNEGVITNCYWDQGISQSDLSAGGQPKSTSQMHDAATYMGWNDGSWTIDDGNDCPRLTWELAVGMPLITGYPIRTYNGIGTEGEPFVLRDANDLVCMSQRVCDWSGQFILDRDIDMDGVCYVPPADFSGSFEGRGFRINCICVDFQELGNYLQLGLFAKVSGEVRNLGVVDIQITGGDLSNTIGGLCGTNWGNIVNCFVTGWVIGGNEVSWCGGLCGVNAGIIDNSYSMLSVTCGDEAFRLGGLCGCNIGTISNCYSSGAVTGGDGASDLGGLCGFNYGPHSPHGVIDCCYSTGVVSGGSGSLMLGGLCGFNCDGNITNCFWDVQTSGLTTSDGGWGKYTSVLQKANTFVWMGWDFDDVWWINEGRDYPKLSWQPFGDVDHDSRVDLNDLAVMAAAWG